MVHTPDPWPRGQRLGFAAVLLVAVVTLATVAVVNPSPRPAALSDLAALEELPGTRGAGKVINGCTIQPFTRCPGADLEGADLEHADLRNATLLRAQIFNANLTRAVLWDADLRLVNFTESNLSGASLRGADLNDATLILADLR